MAIDKIRNMPVDKILSYRRNPQSSAQEDAESPHFLPSHLNNMSEQQIKHSKNYDSSSDSDDSDLQMLPPPRRSPMSSSNIQRLNYHRYLLVIKILGSFVVICCLLRLVPYHKLEKLDVKTNRSVILLWNNEKSDEIQRSSMECGCVVTNSVNYSTRAFDAVVFNVDRPYSFRGLGKLRHTPNYLVVFAGRNPLSLTQDPLPPLIPPPFNYTMTYRLDSDVIWTDYFFSTRDGNQRLKEFSEPYLEFVHKMPGRLAHALHSKIKMKQRLAMYLMYEVNSYTHAESLYLEEVRKHIELDAYESFPSTQECTFYHFMLIFDPSACPDYLNPEFYMALSNHVIPVMIGGGNLTYLVPPHSYISSHDFGTAKELVKYLLDLVADPQRYQEYFWWQAKYKLQTIKQPYCALCLALHETPRKERSSNMFTNWWFTRECTNRTVTSF